MAARQPIVSGSAVPAPDITGRAFPTLATPAGSGPSCWPAAPRPRASLTASWPNSGGAGSKIVVIAAGYAKSQLATKDAKAFAASLAAGGASATWFVLDSKTKTADVTAALSAAQGVLLDRAGPGDRPVQPDRSAGVTAAIQMRGFGGAALLANDAAASAISAGFTADARPGDSTAEIEAAGVAEFLSASVTPVVGLGWVDVASSPGSSRTVIGAGSTASSARRRITSHSASMRDGGRIRGRPGSAARRRRQRRRGPRRPVRDVRDRHEWRPGGPLGDPRHLRRRGVDRAVDEVEAASRRAGVRSDTTHGEEDGHRRGGGQTSPR